MEMSLGRVTRMKHFIIYLIIIIAKKWEFFTIRFRKAVSVSGL